MHESEQDAQAAGDEQATRIPEQTKRQAERAREQAGARLEQEAARGRNAVAREASQLSRAFRRSAEEIEQDGSSALGGPLRQLAGMCDDVSSQLGERGAGELLSAVEDFGRRQPLLFFGASIAAGFAATRFLRTATSGGLRTATGGKPQQASEGVRAPDDSPQFRAGLADDPERLAPSARLDSPVARETFAGEKQEKGE